MSSSVTDSISFRLLFDNAALAAMIVMNPEGIIIDANKAMETTYGHTKTELFGRHFSMLFTSEDKFRQLPEIELATVLQKGSMTDINYIINKDGAPIWTNGETMLTKDAQGRTILVKAIFNIHKEKLQEELLIAANKELEAKNSRLAHVNKEQETFVYMASHDLKAPINNIESLVTIVIEALTPECREKTSSTIAMIQDSINRFKSVITDLGNAGSEAKSPLLTSLIYFSEILEDVKLALRLEIEKSKVKFSEDFLISTLPDIPAGHMRSILYNLLSNAIKYSSPERRPEIKIRTEKREGFIILRVSDNGVGIKEDYWEKVFEMYHRVDTQNHIEGTGIGLSIVNRLVTNAGGRVELNSIPDKGSTFKIYLPLGNVSPG